MVWTAARDPAGLLVVATGAVDDDGVGEGREEHRNIDPPKLHSLSVLRHIIFVAVRIAATFKAKINRRRLDKLDIIKICEEILNPSVPMALRLSGILMGEPPLGDYYFAAFLAGFALPPIRIELNQAWKIRPAVDHTLLPKGKAQAKYEAVTLPENMMDMELERPVLFTNTDTARFRGMRLEDLDEQYVNVNLDDDDISRADRHHQAEAVNITLVDNFESGFAETDIFTRFERFDIADDDTIFNITPDGHPEAPSTLVPSPPRPEDPFQQQQQRAAPSPIREEPQQGDSLKEQEEQKTKKINPIQAIKMGELMDLPPSALMCCSDDSQEIYYPQQLRQLWKECTKVNPPKPSSSSGVKSSSSSQETQPRNSSPQVVSEHISLLIYFHQHLSHNWFNWQPQGDQNEMGAQPMDFTDLIEEMRANKSGGFEGVFDGPRGARSVTPGSPGLSRRSASSSGGSGRGGFLPLGPEIPLQFGNGRAKRKQLSSGRSLGNLDPIEEEFPMEQEGRDFKLRRVSEFGPTPDLMEETEPTQTPFSKQSSPPDHITESIHSYLKLHFESADAPLSESLSHLTHGMNTAQAARLFYQTCVLATRDHIKVTQDEAYGPIHISKGANM
ncbi:Sister chromatid cohesion 1 protein 1 [Hordeum vulgare]|nr:Sister chromatid cohesion 1 protein 1 [Hordeum vulgare]